MTSRSLTLAAGEHLYDVRIGGPERDGSIEFTVVSRQVRPHAGREAEGVSAGTPAGTPTRPSTGKSASTSNAASTGTPMRARIAARDGEMRLIGAGARLRCAVARDGRGVWVGWRGRTVYLEPASVGGTRARSPGAGRDEVRAPMTGVLLEVRAAPGACVAQDEVVAVMEAMKMEYRLLCPREGVVREVAFAPGDRVELGAVVVRLAPVAPKGSEPGQQREAAR